MPSRFRPDWIRSWRLLSPIFFFLCSTLPAGAGEQPVVLEKGHPIPQKGAMVTQFREDLTSEVDGPETVIRKYEDEHGNQVFEFIINGSLFQLQVIPADGIPYLLIDTNGDGLFDSRMNGHEPKLVLPQWVLFRF
ncbi:MAG: hypothetical protein HW380_3925 [Magnetococcales bacterium]|nr:hypothetical protein [Magnetococcales bacterium]HIJ82670.1 DUF2782 domain-containing protein [Magnetococcales bacterium]